MSERNQSAREPGMAPLSRTAACVPDLERGPAFGEGGRAGLRTMPHEIQQARPNRERQRLM